MEKESNKLPTDGTSQQTAYGRHLTTINLATPIFGRDEKTDDGMLAKTANVFVCTDSLSVYFSPHEELMEIKIQIPNLC